MEGRNECLDTVGGLFSSTLGLSADEAGASLQSLRRRFCGEILSLALAEREAHPQSGMGRGPSAAGHRPTHTSQVQARDSSSSC